MRCASYALARGEVAGRLMGFVRLPPTCLQSACNLSAIA